MRAASFSLALLGALLILSSGALAHAHLSGAAPPPGARLDRPPPSLVLEFSEPVEDRFTHARVLDANGTRVDLGSAVRKDRLSLEVALPAIPDGVYFVLWRALSVDTHTTTGSYVFSVNATIGDPTPPGHADHEHEHVAEGGPSGAGTPEAAVRALGFAGATLAAGAPLVLLWLRGFPAPAARRLAVVGAVGGVAAAVAAVSLLSFVGGRIGSDALGALGTATGRAIAGRAFMFGLCAAALWMAATRGRQQVPWALPAAAGSGALGLLATSLSSHAAAQTRARDLAVGADLLHLLAVAFWVCGVVALVLLLRTRPPPATAAALVRRFSPAAMTAVALIVATGVYASLLHVPSPGALTASVYGAALLTKMGLMVPLLLLGAYNRYGLAPRLEASGEHALRRLAWSAGAEVVLMAAALVAAGALANTAPPASPLVDLGGGTPPPQEFVHNGTLEGHGFQVALDPFPARPGPSFLTVTFTPSDDGLPENAAVFVTFWSPSDPHGDGHLLELTRWGPSSWSLEGPLFTEPGAWRLRLVLQGRGAYEATEFHVQV